MEVGQSSQYSSRRIVEASLWSVLFDQMLRLVSCMHVPFSVFCKVAIDLRRGTVRRGDSGRQAVVHVVAKILHGISCLDPDE
jgi:hypothetical protein